MPSSEEGGTEPRVVVVARPPTLKADRYFRQEDYKNLTSCLASAAAVDLTPHVLLAALLKDSDLSSLRPDMQQIIHKWDQLPPSTIATLKPEWTLEEEIRALIERNRSVADQEVELDWDADLDGEELLKQTVQVTERLLHACRIAKKAGQDFTWRDVLQACEYHGVVEKSVLDAARGRLEALFAVE